MDVRLNTEVISKDIVDLVCTSIIIKKPAIQTETYLLFYQKSAQEIQIFFLQKLLEQEEKNQ